LMGLSVDWFAGPRVRWLIHSMVSHALVHSKGFVGWPVQCRCALKHSRGSLVDHPHTFQGFVRCQLINSSVAAPLYIPGFITWPIWCPHTFQGFVSWLVHWLLYPYRTSHWLLCCHVFRVCWSVGHAFIHFWGLGVPITWTYISRIHLSLTSIHGLLLLKPTWEEMPWVSFPCQRVPHLWSLLIHCQIWPNSLLLSPNSVKPVDSQNWKMRSYYSIWR